MDSPMKSIAVGADDAAFGLKAKILDQRNRTAIPEALIPPMQRIINDPDLVVEDMLQGFTKAYPHLVAKTNNPRVLKYARAPIPGKVGVVTGGGSRHKPAFIGYLGKNMCDAVAVGEIFTSPSAQSFLDAFKAADGGKGVACLYGNYAGDNLNVKMARQLAEAEGWSRRASRCTVLMSEIILPLWK
jgi:dihydroxyacetone kinase